MKATQKIDNKDDTMKEVESNDNGLEQLYSFCKTLQASIKKKKGVINLKMMKKIITACHNYFLDQDLDIAEYEKFTAFLIEKYEITDCLISYPFVIYMLGEYIKMEDINIPLVDYEDYMLNEETRLLFKKKGDKYVAFGRLDDGDIEALSITDVTICSNNQWLWDFNSVSKGAKHIQVSPYVTVLDK